MSLVLRRMLPALLGFLGALYLASDLRCQTQSAPKAPPPKVLLIIDEQHIHDSDRARLAQIISDVAPTSSWVRVAVPRSSSKELFVNRVFRYYGSVYPATTRALIAAIDRANGFTPGGADWAGGTVLVPPFPVRGYQRYNFGRGEARLYDVQTREYSDAAKSRQPQNFATLFVDTPTINSQQKVIEGDTAALRDGNVTALSVPVTPALLNLVDTAGADGLPEGVMALTPGGFVQVELFGGDTSSCRDAEQWETDSPYLPYLRKQIASLSLSELDSLSRRADRSPLVVVDWDIASLSKGHGSKVVSVVDGFLDFLGLQSLRKKVYGFELNPYGQRAAVKTTVSEYQRFLQHEGQLEEVAKLFDFAQQWLDTATAPPSSRTYVVPEFILRAMLWKALNRDSLWVNLSFSVPNPSFTLQPPALARRKASFGIVAAGNLRTGLDPLATLQNVASYQPNLVNVTAGARTGSVWGTYSDPSQRMVVSLVAPGCGFNHGTISPVDSGSSYASPYVATAAWASHLISGIPMERMRNWLVVASRLAPEEMKVPVESNGLFDPALLLTLPSLRSHLLGLGGDLQLFDSVSLDIRIGTTDNYTTVHINRAATEKPTNSFSIYPCDASYCAFLTGINENALSETRGRLLDVRLRWVANGVAQELTTADNVARMFRRVMY
jgi:hypothetical protein